MQSGFYVALSGQIALQRRMDSIANNVANSSTAGFRAENIKFESVLSQVPPDSTAFVSAGEPFLSRASGELIRTDNLLDIAIEGDAWLAIQTPSGQVFTRDGRMRITDEGVLQTLNGYPILDVGGAPVVVEPEAGPVLIARDGTITQGDRQIGAIGLFRLGQANTLHRFDNSGLISEEPADPVLDFVGVGVVQGYVERANVNPVLEMTRLVMVSRAFDAAASVINEVDSSLQSALRTLGPGS